MACAIHETRTGESKGGRKPVMLELNPGSFYSVGIDLDVGCMNIILIDITSKVISTKQLDIPLNLMPEAAAIIPLKVLFGK